MCSILTFTALRFRAPTPNPSAFSKDIVGAHRLLYFSKCCSLPGPQTDFLQRGMDESKHRIHLLSQSVSCPRKSTRTKFIT